MYVYNELATYSYQAAKLCGKCGGLSGELCNYYIENREVSFMDGKVFCNLIGRKEMPLSGKTYKAASEFFIDYSVQCADSNIMDVKIVISKAKNAMEELQSMPVEKRKQILMKFIDLISSDEEFEKHVTLMSGLPISYSRNQAQELVSFFKDQMDELFVNYEVKNNNIYS